MLRQFEAMTKNRQSEPFSLKVAPQSIGRLGRVQSRVALFAGQALAEMPLFLNPDEYVPVPLEATYTAAWEAVPTFRRNTLAAAVADRPRQA